MKIDNDILFLNNIHEHDRLILLVDEINQEYSLGITKNYNKVLRNIHLLGFDVRNEFEREMKKTTKSLICIWELGRYLTIVRINSNREEGMMIFFENKSDNDEVLVEAIRMLQLTFPPEVVDKFAMHYREMQSNFEEEDNVVELSLDAYDLN